MRILLTSTGTRGDIQPLLALALELKFLGHQCLFCTPPNFTTWLQEYGFENRPIGIDLEQSTRDAASGKVTPLSRIELKKIITSTVRYQVSILVQAARGCDLIIGGGIAQVPTRTVADMLHLPCMFAAFCPVVYPSLEYRPPPMSIERYEDLSKLQGLDVRSLWADEEQYWNELYRDVLNEERDKSSLAAIDNVLRHALEGQSLLAADKIIMPFAKTIMYDIQVEQTGAWLLPTSGTLPEEVMRFLAEGEAPLYFGCGSMIVKESAARLFVEAARSVGKRVIIYKGWSNIQPVDSGRDCLFVDALAHDDLFPHMAAVIHHGGAGTTTTAARAGVSQVILPHAYDQFYLANRVQQLGIGIAGSDVRELTGEELIACLHNCLATRIAERACIVADDVETNGAAIAAEWLAQRFA